MKTSKRRRQFILSRPVDIEDRVSFFKTHVATVIVYFESELQQFWSDLAIGMKPAHDRILAIGKSDQKVSKDQFTELNAIRSYMGHMVRYGFIHVFAQFDHWVLLSLDVYGSLLDKAVSYSDDTGGALRILPQFLSRETAAKLDPLKSRLEFYLALRNQFAHYPYSGKGGFYMKARQENFESLVKQELGLECGPSLHAFMRGQPGFVMQYSIVGDGPIMNLIELVKAYYAGLLDEWMREVMDAHGTASSAPGCHHNP